MGMGKEALAGPTGPPGPKGDDGVSQTPKRVSTLPDAVVQGEQLYVTAAYAKTNGFDITPTTILETAYDGYGLGNRLWARDVGNGYGEGRLYSRRCFISKPFTGFRHKSFCPQKYFNRLSLYRC